MKNLLTLSLFFILASPYAYSQDAKCDKDLNCYYEQEAKNDQINEIIEREEEEEFDKQQRELEEQRLLQDQMQPKFHNDFERMPDN